jgi:hypothetical protein
VVGIHLGWHYLYARTIRPSSSFGKHSSWTLRSRRSDTVQPGYLQKGMHPEVIAALRAALTSRERDREIQGKLGHLLAVAGRLAKALAPLEGLGHLSATRYVSPYSVALDPCRAG